MSQERKDAVTFKGNAVTLVGPELKVGDRAPDFTALAGDLSEVHLANTAGKVRIISVVPSIDTPVCDTQTRRFNEAAAGLGDDIAILTVSADLPFAQKRFCGAAGIDKVVCYSDHRDADFGTSYGTLIKELRLLARAVFVVDREGVVRHVEYVKEITEQPDYDSALAAARECLS